MRKNTYCTWLGERIAPYHVALKQPCWDHKKGEYKVDADGNFILEPRPINTNDRILSVLVNHSGYLHKLRNRHFDDHMKGIDIFYFQGNGQASAPETLVMIDIDCLKCLGLGSKKGAHEFATHLKDEFFPDLYFETSTNGNGVHGYFVLHKLGLPAKTANAQLRTFEKL